MEMKEREIDLLDLLVEILLHWRTILAAMLLGGILLGGYSYLGSLQDARITEEMLEQQQGMSQEELAKQWETREYSLRSGLSDVGLERVNAALALRQRYAERLDYQKHSMLMQLDPAHIQTAELIFAIQADNADDIYSITDMYEHLLAGVACHAYVKERCGIEGDVSEIIALSSPENSALQIGVLQGDVDGILPSGVFVQKERSNVICVQILHDDADICDAMADAVAEFAGQQQKELQGTLGRHEIVLLSRSQAESENYEVLTLQNICANALCSLSDSYTRLMKEIAGAELEYYNLLLAGKPVDKAAGDGQGEESEQKKADSKLPKPVVSVKYVLLGIALFAFMYAFALGIKYIFNNKIRSTDDLCELYGIPQLGMVPRDCGNSKRVLGVVDRWILKLRYHDRRMFTPKESIELAAVAVKMAALKENIQSVCCLGCGLKENTAETCGQIKEQLGSVGIEVITLNNVPYDAEAMERLGGMESAVLVETGGVTLYEEIAKELELLKRQGIAVLGGIVVEC